GRPTAERVGVARSPTGPLPTTGDGSLVTRPVNGSRATRSPVPPAAQDPRSRTRLGERLAQRLASVVECLRGFRQCSGEAHESMEHAEIALVARGDPELAQPVGVSLAIVTEWVAL